MCCIGKWPHCSSLQNRFLVMNLAIAQNQEELLTRTMKNSLNYNVSLPNLSTTTITAMGCCQCLSLSVVQLKGKHCWKPHSCNGVVDTFGPGKLRAYCTNYICCDDLFYLDPPFAVFLPTVFVKMLPEQHCYCNKIPSFSFSSLEIYCEMKSFSL